jgi:chromate transporter
MPTLAEASLVYAKIGLLGFGGPAGQIALMHRELVERRRWIGEQRFLHALNCCMLLPGPEAQQLATYIGWLLHGTMGGLVAGTLFVLPGAAIMLALSILYALFRSVPLVEAGFFGIKAAILAVVIEAALRIGRRALTTTASRLIAGTAFAALFIFHLPFPLIIVAAGATGWLIQRPVSEIGPTETADEDAVVDLLGRRSTPSFRRSVQVLAIWLPIWLGPVAILWIATGGSSVWTGIGRFFATMAVVTFGGAYAVLAYVADAAVGQYHWLTPPEMLDGLGLAETTPGPLILVLQFVGFLAAYGNPGGLSPLLAGCLGAGLTLWVTFAPCFLWIFLGGPYAEALRRNERASGALSAITAAVVGVIVNLALWFACHVVFHETVRVPTLFGIGPDLPVLASVDLHASILAAAAILGMLWFRWGLLPVLGAAALAGIALSRLPAGF